VARDGRRRRDGLAAREPLIERSDASSLPALSAPASIGDGARRRAAHHVAPQFQNPSAQLHETLRAGDAKVGLYVGYYRNQSSDRSS
jgi:hypothetical protein